MQTRVMQRVRIDVVRLSLLLCVLGNDTVVSAEERPPPACKPSSKPNDVATIQLVGRLNEQNECAPMPPRTVTVKLRSSLLKDHPETDVRVQGPSCIRVGYSENNYLHIEPNGFALKQIAVNRGSTPAFVILEGGNPPVEMPTKGWNCDIFRDAPRPRRPTAVAPAPPKAPIPSAAPIVPDPPLSGRVDAESRNSPPPPVATEKCFLSIRVVDEAEDQPLEGAAVIADSSLVGSTNVEGVVCSPCEASGETKRIAITRPGYRVAKHDKLRPSRTCSEPILFQLAHKLEPPVENSTTNGGALALTIAGGAVAVIGAGLWTYAAIDALYAERDGIRLADLESRSDTVHTVSGLGIGVGAAGVALAGVGAYLLLTTNHEETSRPQIRAGVTRKGFVIQGAF